MKTSQILHRFTAKDGREVILRTPKWEDLDDLLNFTNSLAEEELDVLPERRVMTRDEEANWLGKILAEIEQGRRIVIVTEVDKKVISNAEVHVKGRSQKHKGELVISILSDYRDVGIGTEMMKTLIEESKKAGLKVLVLQVFAHNDRALHLYEKVGFKEIGRIPNGWYRNGKYIDEVIMVKELE